MVKSIRWALAVTAAAALLVAGCGGGDDSSSKSSSSGTSSSGKPVTINWWHIANTDPLKTVWKQAADEYMKAHPNVTIKITVLENEAFKAKLTTNMQAGNPPDIFQSWGGGTLKEQADASLVQDITKQTSSWIGTLNPAAVGLYKVGDKQYGVPYNLGMVGVWYNKALFKKAGIDAPPATWTDFLADVKKLKDAGITPIAVGEKDKWPGMFWWANLSLRIAGMDALAKAGEDGSFDAPGFVQAGEELKKLIDMQPFQKSFLAAPWPGATGEAGTMAKQAAAMDLMGQWAPNEFNANTKDKKGLGDDLGWFPFPQVAGGAGQEGEQFGGGDGFAFGKDAPPETVDFLKHLVSLDAANQWGALNSGILPTTNGSEASTTDPMLSLVLEGRAKAKFVQLYLDQATSPELGGAINEAVATLYAGTGTPESVVEAIQAAAKQ